MNQLSARHRPKVLAGVHPRIVNKLALCWSDAALTGRVLADLLMDKRGGRRGFPRLIAAELENLRELNARRLKEEIEEEDVWAPSRQATSDR